MSTEIRRNPTNVVDLAEARAERAARRRATSQERRFFLWGWPTTGQLLAAEFPNSAAASSSLEFRSL